MKRKLSGMIFLSLAIFFLGKAGYMDAKAELAQYLLKHAWQKSLKDGVPHAPWPWADTVALAQLSFPDLDEQFVVLSGASGRNLAFAPAHVSGSVYPGDIGVSVIGGHRDTHFLILRKLNLGDEIQLQTELGITQHFVVNDILIADVRDSEIRLDAETPTLALVACYPFSGLQAGGPLRYLVMAAGLSSKVPSTEPSYF